MGTVEDEIALLTADEDFNSAVEGLSGAKKSKLLDVVKGMLTSRANADIKGDPQKSTSTPQASDTNPPTASPVSQIPKLGFFSGDDPVGKGEVPYEQWRHEVQCLINEKYSDQLIMLSIRRAIRGTAANALLNLGVEVQPALTLEKFDVIFGNVLTSEMLLEDFYTSRQRDKETVTVWGCRIESLLNKAKQQGTIASVEDMARTKFYSGLRNERVKSALRHKFDSGSTFAELLKQARMLEHEFLPSSSFIKVQVQATEATTLDMVMKRMDELEAKLSTLTLTGSAIDLSKVCRYCKKPGHLINDCRILAKKKKATGPGNGDRSSQGGV